MASGVGIPARYVVGAVPSAERDAAVDQATFDAHAALAAVGVVVGGYIIDGVHHPAAAADAVDHHRAARVAGLAGGTVAVAPLLAVDALLPDEAALDGDVAVDAVLVLVVDLHVEARHAEGAVHLQLRVLVQLVVEHRVERLVGLAVGALLGGVVGPQGLHALQLVGAVEVVAVDEAEVVVLSVGAQRGRLGLAGGVEVGSIHGLVLVVPAIEGHHATHVAALQADGVLEVVGIVTARRRIMITDAAGQHGAGVVQRVVVAVAFASPDGGGIAAN